MTTSVRGKDGTKTSKLRTLIRFSALDVGGKSEIRIDTWATC